MRREIKNFSSANLAMLVSFFTLLITYYRNPVDAFNYNPLVATPIFTIGVILGTLYIILKFPILIKQQPAEDVDKSFYDLEYNQDINWLKCLYFGLFASEPSKFVSLFSGVKLHMFVKGRICKFIWENKEVKFIHRILDVLAMLILSFVAFLAGVWLLDINAFALSILACVLIFKKSIFSYSFSINVGKVDGYNLNVIYPHRTNKISLFKCYGLVFPFNKTILITADTFRLNPTIKDYVIAHERGHIEDNKNTLVMQIVALFMMFYLILLPHLLCAIGLRSFALVPLITYFIYLTTVGYKVKERSERFADAYAVKTLGKENCLEALGLMRQQVNGGEFNNRILNFVFRPITVKRRIEMINECF